MHNPCLSLGFLETNLLKNFIQMSIYSMPLIAIFVAVVFDLLLSAVVTLFTIAILVFICLDRHRASRSKYG